MSNVWTDEEESAFAEIMAAGGLGRMESIRLYRRFKNDVGAALKYARGHRGNAKREAVLAKARAEKRIKPGFYRQKRAQTNAAVGMEG
jgi:hypothetical protein